MQVGPASSLVGKALTSGSAAIDGAIVPSSALTAPEASVAATVAEARLADLVGTVSASITGAPSPSVRVMEIQGALEGAQLAIERARQLRAGTSAWNSQVRQGAALAGIAAEELPRVAGRGDIGGDLLLQYAASNAESARHSSNLALGTRIESMLADATGANQRSRTLLLGWLADQAASARTHAVATSLVRDGGAHRVEPTITALANSAIQHLDDTMRTQGGGAHADPLTRRGLAVQRSAQAHRDLSLMRAVLADAGPDPRLRVAMADTDAALAALRARFEFEPGGPTSDIARIVARLRDHFVRPNA